VINVRLISLRLGNTNEATTYFSFLIIFGFFSSLISTVSVYIIDSIKTLNQRIKRLIESNLFLTVFFLIVISINIIFYINKDYEILLSILFFYTLLFELTAALLIIQGQYFKQQKARLVPYLLVLFFLLLGNNLTTNIESILVHGVGLSTLVIIYYFRTLSSSDFLEKINNNKTTTNYNIIFFLFLSICVKYIPVIESNYLIGLAVLPLYVYSSKGYMVTISVIDQIFGLNLYHNSKEWKEKQFYFLCILVIFSVFFLILFRNTISTLVFNLTLINQFELLTQNQLRQLSNSLLLIVPFVIFSVALKNSVINNKGLKIVNLVLLTELLGSLFLYKFKVFDIGIFLPVIVNLFLWASTSIIFLIFSPLIKNSIKAFGIVFLLIYCLYVAKSTNLF
jgi:hypothetical protein